MYEKNINIKNPVEINLSYVQSKDGILKEVYPCTVEEAAKVSEEIIYCETYLNSLRLTPTKFNKSFCPKI